jgi:formate hydrogenlyase subunit 3/multisubunit Na+/H+ antiporter MnhD subunit
MNFDVFFVLSSFWLLLCTAFVLKSPCWRILHFFKFNKLSTLVIFSCLDLLVFMFFWSYINSNVFVDRALGSRERKIQLFTYFFLYTSRLFVNAYGILYIYSKFGTFNWAIICVFTHIWRTVLLWLVFFFSLSLESAIIPFHIWLPWSMLASVICFISWYHVKIGYLRFY